MRQALPLAVLAAASAGFATPAHADTNYYYQGPIAPGTWDTTTAAWASPTSTSTPLTTWLSSNTSDAFFNPISTANITVSSDITANSLNFLQSGKIFFAGNNTITTNSIGATVPNQTIYFGNPVASPGQLTIHGVTYPISTGHGVEFGADTNMFPGGILMTGGSVYLNLDNSARRFAVDPTHLGSIDPSTLNSPGGIIPGSTPQSGPIILTSVSGPGGTFPTITVDGNGSTITLGNVHTNDYVLPNPVALNPSNAANFYIGLGAGSVADSANSLTGGPYPQFATMNFAGQISGNGNVVICNDFYGGGGKGFTIFSNPNNNYTGKTIINNNAQNYLTFMIGAAGAIPATSDVVFGANSLGQQIGDTQITHKQVGALDMNGFNVTVKSLSSDMGTLYDLGVTAVNNHAIDPNIASGSNSLCTLTIDSAGALNNSFFSGNITDGADFLTQDNNASGTSTYPGPYAGNASNYLKTSAGLQVGLKLAATNSGVLTLTNSNGGKVPDYGYSGGTTVSGGSLYINGNLTAPSGSTQSQVLVTTPLAGHVALFGGTGIIHPDIHVQSGATLAPGSTPVALTTGSGTDFSNAPTAFNVGTLTVNNLTIDGGSQLNFLVNDGSTAAIAGTGYGNLAFTAGATFTENGATVDDPIFVHPFGSFSGFANYKSATWTLAQFPAGSSLSDFALDTRNGYTPLPTALLANGTFSVTTNGTSLNLVFTPSPTVTALQYSGSASGAWDSNGTNTVWTDLVHGAGSVGYADPANVLFGTPASNTTITIQAAGVSPASVIFNNAGNTTSYTLTGGPITGAAPLSLNGSGHVILASVNSYTGGTGISSGGTLETQVNGALGTGTISIYNGAWATTTTDQAYANNVQVFGTGNITSAIQTGPTTGSPSGNLTLNGNVAGSGTLTKTGLGTLTINGTLSQSGDLDVNAGRLVINGTALYSGTTSVLANATLEYNTAANTTIGFNPTANLAGNIVFDNTTSVTFTPGTYAGTGNIVLGATNSEVQGIGGTLGGPPVDIHNSIVLNPSNLPNFVAYLGMPGDNNRIWFEGPITGNGNLAFGAGPAQHGGANIYLFAQSTYTGNTTIDTGGQAVLTLETDNALPPTTNLTFGTNGQGSGFLELNGFSQTLASLQTDPLGGGIAGIRDSTGGGTLTINGSTSGKFNAPLQGLFNLNIALQNDAVLTLSWNGSNLNYGAPGSGNIFGGFTNLSSGVLRFANSLAFSPNQNTRINGGVIEIDGQNFGNFTNTLGSDPGDIQILGGTSGFSAYGSAPAIYNLNGGGTVVWGSPFFQPATLVLNESTATNSLVFQNNIDLNGADRTIAVNSTAPGAAANITGAISGSAGLIKTGPGVLILSGNNAYSGGTTVNAGTLAIAAPNALGGGNLTVHAGAAAQLQSTLAGAAVVVSGLTLDGSSGAWTGAVDIGGNKLVVNAAISKPTVLAQIEDQVTFGKTHAAGIFSGATLPSNTGIAVVDNGALATPFSTFGGASVNGNSILIGAELLGDANLDGHVDGADLSTVLSNFGATTKAWNLGNFDGAVTIDLTDLADVLNNFGLSFSNATTFGSATTAAVPEPASLGILGLGILALANRRRKNVAR